MARVTANQVAELAGVSRSAVSRSFSDTASVSPHTRAKVMAAAKTLGYRPNHLASTLAGGKSNIIAIITNSHPDIRRSHMLHLLNIALQNMGMVPYMIAIDKSYLGEQSLAQLIQMPIRTAIVEADAVTQTHISPFCQDAPPIMLNGRFDTNDPVDRVVLDEQTGITAMMQHLNKMGCGKLWMISSRRSSSTYLTRNTSILNALTGTELQLVDQQEGDFTYEGGAEAFRTLMARKKTADCLFCANDMMALGAMDAARFEFNLTIPKDMIIVGFDNIPQASWPTYNLPTIQQDPLELVSAIKNIVHARAQQTAQSEPIVEHITTHYIWR